MFRNAQTSVTMAGDDQSFADLHGLNSTQWKSRRDSSAARSLGIGYIRRWNEVSDEHMAKMHLSLLKEPAKQEELVITYDHG